MATDSEEDTTPRTAQSKTVATLAYKTSGISHVSLRRHSGSQVEPSFNSLAKGLALCRNNEEGRNKAVINICQWQFEGLNNNYPLFAYDVDLICCETPRNPLISCWF